MPRKATGYFPGKGPSQVSQPHRSQRSNNLQKLAELARPIVLEKASARATVLVSGYLSVEVKASGWAGTMGWEWGALFALELGPQTGAVLVAKEAMWAPRKAVS